MAPYEIELKFEVAVADRDRLQRLLSLCATECPPQHLVAIYFDTPATSLRKQGYTLRIRNRGQLLVQTIKADQGGNAGMFARREWERVVPDKQPLLDGGEPLSGAIAQDQLAGLAPAFVSDIERIAYEVPLAGAIVEAVLDRGDVIAGARAESLCELELELKQGAPSGLFDLARQLDGQVPLRIEVRSKAERGYGLLTAETASAAKSPPVELDPGTSTSEAFARIATSCLRQYRIHEATLLHRLDPEAVHQARVALRRLRTAIGLFKPLFSDDERAVALSAEARLLAHALGELRNLDVLIEELGNDVPAAVRASRERATQHATAALHSSRPRLLMLDLVEWLTTGAWREQPPDRDLAESPVTGFAANALKRAHKRFRRAADDLSGADEAACHRARIAAKKLRYAGEFFATLSPPGDRRLKKWLKTLKDVQDDLGRLNDVAVGNRILSGLGQKISVPAADLAALQRSAEKDCAALAHAKPFWRDWGNEKQPRSSPQ